MPGIAELSDAESACYVHDVTRLPRWLAQAPAWQYLPAVFALSMILAVVIAYVAAWMTGGVTSDAVFFTRSGNLSVASLAAYAGTLAVGMTVRRLWSQHRRIRRDRSR